MAGISDYIMRQLMAGQRQQAEAESVAREANGPAVQDQLEQGQPVPPDQAASQQVDPRIDYIAKRLAMVEGRPEEKYQIFVSVLPQIIEAFTAQMQGGAGPEQGGGTSQYEVGGNVAGR